MVDVGLVRVVRDLIGAGVFIETGTGLGRTSEIMSREFATVLTIEVHDIRFSQAVDKFSGTNVVPIHGESPDILGEHVVNKIREPVVFFLDAHCPYREVCSYSECVLSDELRVLAYFMYPMAIFIDDMDLFFTPKFPGGRRENWPDLVGVVDLIREIDDFFIFVWNNNVVAVPQEHREAVSDYIIQVRE